MLGTLADHQENTQDVKEGNCLKSSRTKEVWTGGQVHAKLKNNHWILFQYALW